MVLLLFRRTGILILLFLISLPLTGCGTTPELFDVTITWTEGGYVYEKVNGEWVEAESDRSVEANTSIQLRAVANPDYEFQGWEVAGADHGELNNEEITVTNFAEGALIKANFYETTPELFDVIITWTDGGFVEENVNGEWVEAESERSVEANTIIQLRAVANPDYEFTGWEVAGAGHGDLNNEEITVTHFTDDASIKASFEEYLDVFLVHDAHDLHDALDVQDQYDVIRLGSDILTSVDFDVILSSHGLRFDLNGYKLLMEADRNFQITGDSITVRGSEIELQGLGEFLILGYHIDIEGLTLTTEDEDFYVETGGAVSLTINDSDFFLGVGQFFIDVEDIEDKEVILYISGCSFTARRFYVYCSEAEGNEADNSQFFVNVSNSEFYIDTDFAISPAGNGTELEMTVSNSLFMGGSFKVYGYNDNQELTLTITSTEFNLTGKFLGDGFRIDASGDDGKITMEMTDCNVELEGPFMFFNGTNDVSSLIINSSDFDLGGNFLVEADEDGVDLTLEVNNSDFDLGGNTFRIDAGKAAAAHVNINDCTFEEGRFRFDVDAIIDVVDLIQMISVTVFETLDIYDATNDGDPIDEPGDFGNAIDFVTINPGAEINIYWDGTLVETLN